MTGTNNFKTPRWAFHLAGRGTRAPGVATVVAADALRRLTTRRRYRYNTALDMGVHACHRANRTVFERRAWTRHTTSPYACLPASSHLGESSIPANSTPFAAVLPQRLTFYRSAGVSHFTDTAAPARTYSPPNLRRALYTSTAIHHFFCSCRHRACHSTVNIWPFSVVLSLSRVV